MTVGSPAGVLPAPVQELDALTALDRLQARVRSAEERAATLERALSSNRRIGMAVGILMSGRRLTEDKAVELLKKHSQHRNVKMRELAETVILTGTV